MKPIRYAIDGGSARIFSAGDYVRYDEYEILAQSEADYFAAMVSAQDERDMLRAKLEIATIDAEFFKGEVKLRNKIPATNDTAADLFRENQMLRAKLKELGCEGY